MSDFEVLEKVRKMYRYGYGCFPKLGTELGTGYGLFWFEKYVDGYGLKLS